MFNRFCTLIILFYSFSLSAQEAYIRIESQAGVSVSIDTTCFGHTTIDDKSVVLEDLSPGNYDFIFQLDDKILESSIELEDENERLLFVDFEKGMVEDFSPVNRPSKKELLEYTNPDFTYDTITDKRDGKIYKTIVINTQTWIAENLNYHIRGGSYVFPRDSINEKVYGRLYTWDAAMSACPKGWHLPSDDEWMELEEYLAMKDIFRNARGWRVCEGDKSIKSDLGWLRSNNASDYVGFSAYPGGYFDPEFLFCCEGFYGYFWTSTEGGEEEAWYRVVSHDINHIGKFCYQKGYGFSVRCIKD